jgi:DNA-binding MarR family transcriptional regulator
MTNSSISLIARINDHARQWLSHELASVGVPGLVPSHGDVLALLFLRGEASMHELAEFAHRTRPTTTVLVAKLERLGLVGTRQSEHDARSVVVSMTERGESLRTVFDGISRRLVAFASAGLSPEEATELERLLGKVLSGMENADHTTENDNDEGSQDHR